MAALKKEEEKKKNPSIIPRAILLFRGPSLFKDFSKVWFGEFSTFSCSGFLLLFSES